MKCVREKEEKTKTKTKEYVENQPRIGRHEQ